MAHIARRGERAHKAHDTTALTCILLALVGAASVIAFGYVLYTCLSMEGMDPYAPMQSLAEAFRHRH